MSRNSLRKNKQQQQQQVSLPLFSSCTTQITLITFSTFPYDRVVYLYTRVTHCVKCVCLFVYLFVCLFCALRWTGGLSRVSPAFALSQLGLAPVPRDPNEDEAVLMMDVCLFVCVTGIQRREDQQRDPLQTTAPLQQR